MTRGPRQIHCMREEFGVHLLELSDHDLQKASWTGVDRVGKINVDHLINFVFDDTDLRRDPERLIGVFLYDMEEVEAVWQLTTTLRLMFGKHGYDLTDQEYIHPPEWADVLIAAKTLHRMICTP